MKLTGLTLSSFRSHQNTVVDGLDRVNIFLGHNGAGKSSILDAIAYAMTGVCRGVDEGGRGADGLTAQLAPGTKAAASVNLRYQGGEIIRAVGQGPRSQAHTRIMAKLGLDERVLRAVAAPLNILRLPAKKQEELFFLLTGSSVTVEQVAAALKAAECPVDQAARLTTPAGREEMLAYFKTRRVEVKRIIAGLVVPDGEAQPFNAEELAEKEKQLAEWRSELSATRNEYDRSVQAIRDIDDRIRDVSNRLTVARSQPAGEFLTEERINSIKASIQHHRLMRESLARIQSELDSKVHEMQAARKELKRIKELKAECPECGQKVSKKFISDRAMDLSEYAEKTFAESKAINDKAMLIIRDLELNNVEDMEAKLREHDRADIERASRKRECSRLDEELKELSRKKAAIPAPKERDWSDAEKSIADLAHEVEVSRAAKGLLDQAVRINQRRSESESELSGIEKMVKALGPGGPVAGLMASDGTAAMIEDVRSIGRNLGVGDLSITASPWNITLNGRPVELASASEEFRIAAAFGIAFAKKAGASLVCLDGAEILFGEFRDMFQSLLFDCGIEQVFVAATCDEYPKLAEAVPGLSMYRVSKNPAGVSQVKLMEASK